ncbi:MAG: hypothetical protein O3B82_03145 [Bacteroidetes bacterium]|nr:hypothetical protein [Bacteroidota bacterium]
MPKTSRKRKIIANLLNKHRFVLINDTTFAEVFSVRLTPINVLMLISSVLLFFSLLVLLLLAYTPMQAIVPNAVKFESRQELLELNQKIEDLSRKLEVRENKQEVLNTILAGEERIFDSTSVRPTKKQ